MPTEFQKLLERDKEKIALMKKERQQDPTHVDPEDELLAEFGLYFGWDAVWAVKTNSIDQQTMMSLIFGSRKIKNAERYNRVIDTYYAMAGSQSKQGSKALERHLGDLRKNV